MILFNKILPIFVLPLGGCLILIVWGLLRRRPRLIWTAVFVLLVSSNPFVGYYLMRSTEGWVERRPASSVSTADAIVVLSPGRSVVPGPERLTESNDANRFYGGVELFQAGKAPLLVFTGAKISGDSDVPLEGDVLAGFARALGVPAEHIAVTTFVANTADEAKAVATLLRDRQVQAPRVLLVTSAFHMRRSRLLFEQQRVQVDPFPVDFRARQGPLTPMSFLPSVGALMQTQTALREFYGRVFYWLRAIVLPG